MPARRSERGVTDPSLHVAQALGYVRGQMMVACAASEEQIDITGWQLMMLLQPLEERLERIEQDLNDDYAAFCRKHFKTRRQKRRHLIGSSHTA